MATQIELKGQNYNGKVDFKVLATVQNELRKQGIKMTIQEMLSSLEEQNLLVIYEIIIQAILRCHPQLNRKNLEDKFDFAEADKIFDFFARVMTESMPASEGK